MTAKDGAPVVTVGCGGLLLLPLSTVALGSRLLVAPPGREERQKLGPYRVPARGDDDPRPLTAGSMRVAGALFLFWTLLLPGAAAARAVMIWWETPLALIPAAGVMWLGMLAGHLISVKLFRVIEPRLPHDA